MKNLLFILVSVFLLSVSQTANTQEVKKETTNENVNFLQFYDNEMFHWNLSPNCVFTLNYGIDNWVYSIYDMHINNERIRNALIQYSESAQAYNTFRKKATTGSIFYWIGNVFIIGSIIPIFLPLENEILRTGLSTGFFVGGLTLSSIGSYHFTSSQSYLINASNIFNRNKVRELNK